MRARAGRLLDVGNNTTIEFANHRRQILHDLLPLSGLAKAVLLARNALGSRRNGERWLRSCALDKNCRDSGHAAIVRLTGVGQGNLVLVLSHRDAPLDAQGPQS